LHQVLRQRHAERSDLVELLANEKMQLVPIVRLVLHACHEEPELTLQIFERHVVLLTFLGGTPERWKRCLGRAVSQALRRTWQRRPQEDGKRLASFS
jgi:hypothetical protein